MKKQYKLKTRAEIIDGSISYQSIKDRDKLRDFLRSSEGHSIDITIEIADSPEYFQHKYYRGYLVPDVAFNSSEVDNDYIHELLKKRFLFKHVSELKEIPNKYRKRCIRYVNQESELIGYTPSTANLTYKEMKEYILKVEMFLSKMGGHLGDNCNLKDAKECRNKAGI